MCRLGLKLGDRLVDVEGAAVGAGLKPERFRSTLSLLQAGEEALEFVRGLKADDHAIPQASVRLAPPVYARKIVAIGLNYRDHALETGLAIPEKPLCFAKFSSSLTGPFDPVVLPCEDAEVDFEGELGVVIGRDAKNVTESEAMKFVAGYVAFNDVSERKWQFADGQWTRGKSCDTFAPSGPFLVTADEIPNPNALRLRTFLNGEAMQDSNTDQLIFNVAKLVSYLSHSFTLQCGDLIATGTPPGVGFSRRPPVFLRPGDRVEVEIENVGKISNRMQ